MIVMYEENPTQGFLVLEPFSGRIEGTTVFVFDDSFDSINDRYICFDTESFDLIPHLMRILRERGIISF